MISGCISGTISRTTSHRIFGHKSRANARTISVTFFGQMSKYFGQKIRANANINPAKSRHFARQEPQENNFSPALLDLGEFIIIIGERQVQAGGMETWRRGQIWEKSQSHVKKSGTKRRSIWWMIDQNRILISPSWTICT